MADVPAPQDDTAGERGTLTIKDRALERIAAAAALQVPGVTYKAGNLSLLTGRELPRADVTSSGGAVAVNLYISAEWPYDAAALTRRVHDAVEWHLHEYTGLVVHELNVLIVSTSPGLESDPEEQAVPVEYLESDIVSVRTGPRSDLPVIAPLPPLAPPAAAPAAAIIGVAALALAFAAARELLIVKGTYGGAPWLRNSFEWFGRLHWEPWIAPVAAVLVALGLVTLVTALKPRRRTHLPLRDDGPVATVWMRRTDVARMCSAHVNTLSGVHSARTVVDRRGARMTVSADYDALPDELAATVRAEIEPKLMLLVDPLPLSVTVTRRHDPAAGAGVAR